MPLTFALNDRTANIFYNRSFSIFFAQLKTQKLNLRYHQPKTNFVGKAS
jgi:hypothetical protein